MEHQDDMTHAEVNLDRKTTAIRLALANRGYYVDLCIMHNEGKPTGYTVGLYRTKDNRRLAFTVGRDFGDLYVYKSEDLWAAGTVYDLTRGDAKKALDFIEQNDPSSWRRLETGEQA